MIRIPQFHHCIAVVCVVIVCAGCANPASPSRKDNLNVLCHYMTWFQNRNEDGIIRTDHWQWNGPGQVHDPSKSIDGKLRNIASVNYPRIGVYDSLDPDVIQYHILTAKAAGIQGFVVDWYGPGNQIDRALETLFAYADKLDFKVAICYEEKTCFPGWYNARTRVDSLNKAKADMAYLKRTYANRQNYWRRDTKTPVFVFAGHGDCPELGQKRFAAEEWQQITKDSPQLCFIGQNFDENNPHLRAGFGWIGEKEYTEWFYRTGDSLLAKDTIDFYVGTACPGFDDRGVWGWGNGPRYEARLGLKNYDRYWRGFLDSNTDIIQIATWNDFQEGTVIEPTVQYGNLYLNRTKHHIDSILSRPLSTDSHVLDLPYQWFVLKKFTSGHSEELELAVKAMASCDYPQAQTILQQILRQSGATIPPYLDMDNEYELFAVMSPSARQLQDTMAKVRSESNIAGSAKVTASSAESDEHAPQFAVDSNLTSRWASEASDNQWFCLDFSKEVRAEKATIIWENAFAESYSVKISADGETWQQVYQTDGGKSGPTWFNLHPNTPFRYLRIDCVKRGTKWGYSIRELGVFSH